MASLLGSIFSGLRRRPRPMETVGAAGTAVYGGYVVSTEKSAELASPSRRAVEFSEILANVSVVAAGVRYFLNLVGKAGWKVEPPEGVAGAEEYAERVESYLYAMETPWPRVVRRAAMFRMHGFSIQEWTAKRAPDGGIGLLDVAPRAQATIERWDVDDVSGRVLGVVQRSPQTQAEIYLPREKVVYVVDDSISDSPEGLGLFRHLVEPAKRLRRFQLLEAFAFETDVRGIPVGRAPIAVMLERVKNGTMTQAEFDAAVAPLKDFAESHIKNPQLGVLLDSLPYRSQDEAATPSAVPQWDLELLSGDASASEQTIAAAIERLNREIARILGVEGLLLGGDKVGSMALSKDKSDNLALQVDSTLGELAESFAKDLVRPLFSLNGWPEEALPVLKPDATQFRDIEQISAVLRDMATAGAVLAPDDPVIGEVRDLLGLSRPPEIGDELLDAARRAAAGLPPEPEPELPGGPEPEGGGAPVPGGAGGAEV